MPFFRHFPKEDYSLFSDDSSTQKITNIFRNVDAKNELLDDIVAYQLYTITDGERPDTVSQKIYGDPDYHWTFFVANDTLKNGLKDWPLSQYEFQRYCEINFDPYSVIILPGVQLLKSYSVEINTENYEFSGIETESFVGGLDLSVPFVRFVQGRTEASLYTFDGLRKILNSSDVSKRYKVNRYDEDRYQLWLSAIDTDLLTGVFTFTLADGTDVKDPAVIAWLNDFRTWSRKYRPAFCKYLETIYGTQDFPIEEIVFRVASEEKIRSFAGQILNTFQGDDIITFESSQFFTSTGFINARAAPHHYVNEKGERLTTFDVFNGLNYVGLRRVTYAEYAEEINSARTEIRVVKPENIREFSRTYRDLINS
jgi:hypothetical protein